MCFLIPVDSNPTADKMPINKSKATFEINSGHHNLLTYEMSLKSDNVEFV
jgi:hypothetical protein